MRKLNFLKTIVDFLWITFIILYFFIFLMIIGLLFESNEISPDFVINKIPYKSMPTSTKVLFLIVVLINGLLLYCLNLFRKIINSFKELEIFVELVINNFLKIGHLLVFLGLFNLLFSFIYTFYLKTEKVNRIEFSTSASLWLFLGAGLFFMVLSEIFKIAKIAKEENELTI